MRRHPGRGGRRVAASGAAAGLVLLAACGDGRPLASEPVPSPEVEPGVLVCQGVEVPREVLTGGRSGEDLGEEGQAALAGEEVPPVDDLASWTVAEESGARLTLLRELPEPEDLGAGDVRTHEVLAVARPGGAEGEGWVLASSATCALRVPLPGGLEPASLTRDPARPLDPGSDVVALLATELACASGQDAQGRVQVVDVVQGVQAVDVVLGVEPLEGGADCPSNPPTPVQVRLDAPLGDREVRDAGTEPARTLAPEPAGP
ncbi:hypothetical protein [Pseudokineococcus sp. 1T1Z-3]|uniref:hypothetical protein n=1 Tax=Pseudokineococcus sp. 1T1Z-3 TaxID=3132745 RepID=UPI0030A100A2